MDEKDLLQLGIVCAVQLVGIGVVWGKLSGKVASNQEEIHEISKLVRLLSAEVAELKTGQAVSRRDVEAILKAIDELKNEVIKTRRYDRT